MRQFIFEAVDGDIWDLVGGDLFDGHEEMQDTIYFKFIPPDTESTIREALKTDLIDD